MNDGGIALDRLQRTTLCMGDQWSLALVGPMTLANDVEIKMLDAAHVSSRIYLWLLAVGLSLYRVGRSLSRSSCCVLTTAQQASDIVKQTSNGITQAPLLDVPLHVIRLLADSKFTCEAV